MQIRKKGDEIKKKSSLKLLSQSQPNFAEMILRWSPFKFVSVSTVLYPRWPPLLKIEISSNGQNCSILNQKVPKFELYKHNDEPFNIYYGIFYELWTFTDFDRLCKLEKRGDEIKKIFSSETTEPISTKLCWNDPKVVPFHNYVRERRPVSKIAAITKNRNFFIWPKLLYFKPESAQNLNCISIMMSFLTYITGFLWTLNFCRFWPIMQIRKKGDGIKKNSSPLKLRSQSQTNFAEMILR